MKILQKSVTALYTFKKVIVSAIQAAAYLKQGDYPDIIWEKLSSSQNLAPDLKDLVIKGFKSYLDCLNSGAGVAEIFKNFEKFRIICALRRGPYGVIAVNNLAEQILKSADLINLIMSH
ncbi:hypothetical protein QUF70_00805 [Desulfobacterales bacterium HSG17]|nr:hypothetical protein [Desulfobacterales bacterium HSG17]